MDQTNFNPIEFLNLQNLLEERQKELEPKIWQHMAYFLLTRFLEELPEDKYVEVEAKAKNVKSPEEVFELVNLYETEFETKKLSWLEEYKQGFDLSLVEEKNE